VAPWGEAGWSAFYAQDPDEDATPFVVIYCPDCAEREFGSFLRWLTRARRSERRA
jgi:hypothetical protein